MNKAAFFALATILCIFASTTTDNRAMSFTLDMIVRLLVAAALVAAIGYERELRAKGAGVRTHVLVALDGIEVESLE